MAEIIFQNLFQDVKNELLLSGFEAAFNVAKAGPHKYYSVNDNGQYQEHIIDPNKTTLQDRKSVV